MGAESLSPWGAAAGLVTDLAGIGVDIWKTKKAEEEAKKQREFQEKMAKRKAEDIKSAGGQALSTYNELIQMIQDNEAGRQRYVTPEMQQNYIDALQKYSPDTYDFKSFDYDKSVEDFINPEASKIAELAGLQTQAELAGQGAAKGSGALANMGYSRWKAAEDLYKDAQDQLLADRSQTYKEYGDYIDRMQKKLDTLNAEKLQQINVLGGAIGKEEQNKSDFMADLIAAMGDKGATQANIGVAAYS